MGEEHNYIQWKLWVKFRYALEFGQDSRANLHTFNYYSIFVISSTSLAVVITHNHSKCSMKQILLVLRNGSVLFEIDKLLIYTVQELDIF